MQIKQHMTFQSPVPPGEVLDRLRPHIPEVGERWMALFESNVHHQQEQEREATRINAELGNKALDNQAKVAAQDGETIKRAQRIVGGLFFAGFILFGFLIFAAYRLFMNGKPWPGVAFSAFAGVLGLAFRSIVAGYLQKPPAPKK
nr:hypothetical protein [uncultured Holophaga sp.]